MIPDVGVDSEVLIVATVAAGSGGDERIGKHLETRVEKSGAIIVIRKELEERHARARANTQARGGL